MPYTEVQLPDGRWYVYNANGIITAACMDLQELIGRHKRAAPVPVSSSHKRL